MKTIAKVKVAVKDIMVKEEVVEAVNFVAVALAKAKNQKKKMKKIQRQRRSQRWKL